MKNLNEIEQILNDWIRTLSITAIFCSMPETIGVFVQWAQTSHAELHEGGTCGNPDCVFNHSVEEWQKRLHAAIGAGARMMGESDD